MGEELLNLFNNEEGVMFIGTIWMEDSKLQSCHSVW